MTPIDGAFFPTRATRRPQASHPRTWFYVQPDVQGILDPGGRGNIDDALVRAVPFGVPF